MEFFKFAAKYMAQGKVKGSQALVHRVFASLLSNYSGSSIQYVLSFDFVLFSIRCDVIDCCF